MKKQCPCGRQMPYEACCGRFIEDGQLPSTPEELMRSRYSAYTQAKIDYIERTMSGPAAAHFDPESARTWARSVKWLGLQVLKASPVTDNTGNVEFIASFSGGHIHELSEFHRTDGRWSYVDGTHISP